MTHPLNRLQQNNQYGRKARKHIFGSYRWNIYELVDRFAKSEMLRNNIDTKYSKYDIKRIIKAKLKEKNGKYNGTDEKM